MSAARRPFFSAFLASCCGTDTKSKPLGPRRNRCCGGRWQSSERPSSGQGFALRPVRTDGRADRPLKRVGRTGEAADAYPDASRVRAAESVAHAPSEPSGFSRREVQGLLAAIASRGAIRYSPTMNQSIVRRASPPRDMPSAATRVRATDACHDRVGRSRRGFARVP